MTGLITGASRGLGLELTKLGLSLGDKVLAASRNQTEKEQELKKLQQQYLDQLVWIKMDVTNEDEVTAAAEFVQTKFSQIDYIINNAGVLLESKFDTRDPVQTFDIHVLRKTLEVNTIGPVIVLKHFISLLYRSPSPCIVNITSEGGALSPVGHHYPAYCMSKSALNQYTQKICNFFQKQKETQKIRTFMIHPGRMDTEMGVENAQIHPSVPAKEIYSIIKGKNLPKMEIPFIDYTGKKL